MNARRRTVIIAGESWIVHSISVKGFDSMNTSRYGDGVTWIRDAIQQAGFKVNFIPNHLAAAEFPLQLEALTDTSVVILSDIGKNTLLLHPETFHGGRSLPNRLRLLRDYVERGGSLVMVGGYLSFQGLNGMAGYRGTPIEDVLPVNIEASDDRVEAPEGAVPKVVAPAHPIVTGLPPEWPAVLGYNRLEAKPDSEVLVRCNDDPLVVVGSFGNGRTMAFASDCGPHWAPPEFVNSPIYAKFWGNAMHWLAQDSSAGREPVGDRRVQKRARGKTT